MLRFMLLFTALVLLVDVALGTLFISWWAMLAAIVPGALLFCYFKITPKSERLQIHGWDIGQGVDVNNPDQPKSVNVTLEDKALNLGMLGIGGPGSGKTIAAIGLLRYFTFSRKKGWAYWDGKGDLDIYQSAMAAGACPDFFFSCELPHSDTVNVMAGPTEQVIEQFEITLIKSDSPYYRNAQRSALKKVVPLLKALQMNISLRDLYVVLSNTDAAMYVMNLAAEKEVQPAIIEAARQFFSIDESERTEQVKGLLNQMESFVLGDFAERLNAYEPTLDLELAAKNNKRVYLHFPLSGRAKDIAIMFSERVGAIANHRQLYERERVAWPQVYDDWGAFFYENFGPITARCRSALMPISFFFQSRGQTDKVDIGRIFTTEITDNIGAMTIMRINGNDTAEWAAKQFGTYESHEVSKGDDNNNRESRHRTVVEKPRVRADALKGLNAGEALISCLVSGEGGRSWNKRYRARFPLPDLSTAGDFDWPIIQVKDNDEADGLHLWRDFMNRDRMQQLKAKVIEEAENAAARTGPQESLDGVDYL